jgi:Flp pilus assembly protein TadD
MFYPAGLAVRYSFPLNGVPVWQVASSLVVLGAIAVWAYAVRYRRPYVLVGWLWYVGMLVPVSQVVPLGTEARCDRYTYLPQIGLYIMIAWLVNDLLSSWRYRRLVIGGAAALSLIALGMVAHAQTAYWKDSVTLWQHAVAVGSPDWITYNNLGLAMTARQRFEDAIQAFQQALQARPDDAYAENNLGIAFVGAGNLEEAAHHFQQALRLKQPYPEADDNLGLIFAKQGRVDEAIRQHEIALTAKPDFPPAHNNLGMILARQGRSAEAMRCYERAIELKPNYAAAHINLGMLLAAEGAIERAVAHYETALQFEPNSVAPHNNLAWVLATHPTASVRNGTRAVELARTASRLAGDNDPEILDTLAAAYAEAGDYEQAVSVTSRAIELARSKANTGLAAQLEQRRALYLRREPYRDGG